MHLYAVQKELKLSRGEDLLPLMAFYTKREIIISLDFEEQTSCSSKYLK